MTQMSHRPQQAASSMQCNRWMSGPQRVELIERGSLKDVEKLSCGPREHAKEDTGGTNGPR